jgi:hypothetical protein
MKPLSKIVACMLIPALIVSSIVLINSAKVNATDSGNGSATGKITIWCYCMQYYSVNVYNETGYPLDDFCVWNTAFGSGGPVEVDYSVLTAINDGKYYSVDKLYTIKVFEDGTNALLYTTYAHGGDEITISYQNGWSTSQGKVPPNPSTKPSATNAPPSKPTYLTPTPYSSPPTSSAQTDNSVANGTADTFSLGELKVNMGTLAVLVITAAVLSSLATLGLTRRTKKRINLNEA